nr:hypothetical protein [Tanacetum cinerariifolium]
MDLRWQMAMLTIRVRIFLKNIKRKFSMNGTKTIRLISPMWSVTTATKGDTFLGSAELQEVKIPSTRKVQEGLCLWKHLLQQLCICMIIGADGYAYPGTDTESQPFEGEARTPESPHIVAPPICHVEESKGFGMSDARSMSSDSTTPLSPYHPLTHTTTVLVPIYHRTACMAVRVSPTMSPGLYAGMAEVAAMSDSAFRKRFMSSYDSSPSLTLPVKKRYRGTSELILGTDSEEDEEVEESLDFDSESKDVEDEGPTTVDEDPAAEDEGLAAEVEGLGVDDESFGLGDESHGVDDESHGLDGEEEAVPEGQQQAVLVTSPSPEWTYGLLLISSLPFVVPSPVSSPMTPLTVPSPIASPMATSVATILVDEDKFIEIDRDVKELYNRSGAVRDDIFSQRYRFKSLEHEQERTVMTFGAVLVHDMLLQQTALQRELQEMRDRVTVLEQERDRKER